MSEGVVGQGQTRTGKVWARLGAALEELQREAGPPLLFGFRLWASVCLALFVAYYLELANASWAGTSAAIVCQPQLGASLRKGWFRLIGTVIGATMIVVLTACFPQDRIAFLGLLALWGGVCAYFATQLRNFASYAAALAGYTAVIVAADTLGATGGPDGQVFMVAITRASEICIGIICAGIVLAGTDLGQARRQLAHAIASLTGEIASRFLDMLEHARHDLPDTQPERREVVRHITQLDPVVDQAIGESSELRYHSPILQSAIRGLFTASEVWRTVASHLTRLPDEVARQQSQTVLSVLPTELRSVLASGNCARWLADPARLRIESDGARRALLALAADTPSLRLLADQTARMLAGIIRVLDGLALLVDSPGQPVLPDGRFHLSVPDRLPALVNAARAFLAIGAAALFWVVTAWPDGAVAMTFVAIAVLLLSPRGDLAPRGAIAFAIATALAVPFAAIAKFALLPNFETFFAFCLVLGLYLVPVGAGGAQTRWPAAGAILAIMGFIFLPVLAPENEISYNTLEFYNAALAIFAGCAAAALAFNLLPPLGPAFRAQRLLDFALRDLRQSAVAPIPSTPDDWEQRMYSRLAALPDKAKPYQRTQLIAALAVGSEVIELRNMEPLLGLNPDLHAALTDLSEGNTEMAIRELGRLDRRLAALPPTDPNARLALRARANILAVTETISQHAAFFDRGAPS
ncbi:MAG: FUSC family protein [Hyphomicrobium sp.]